MKRTIIYAIALALAALAISACGNRSAKKEAQEAEQAAIEAAEKAEQQAAKDAEVAAQLASLPADLGLTKPPLELILNNQNQVINQ